MVVIATDFWRESIDAVRRLGARAVLLAGPDNAPALERELQRESRGRSRDIIALDRAPHSLLFHRASAVVQQCGIGTLAQSLRSGRPMLGVPYSHDQPDNALRARALGMARVVYPSRYRGAKVAGELQTLLTDRRYGAAAERVAETVRSEGGVMSACDALERTFGLTSHAQ